MNNIMLDLETMGQSSNAAIIALGAVQFDITKQTIGQRFYRIIDLTSSVQSGGGVIDPSTIMWWMQQSDAARGVFSKAGEPLPSVLIDLSSWIKSVSEEKDVKIWGNGADFDNVILASAYRYCGLNLPWRFWNNRCYRTVKAMHPDIKMQRIGTYHNAIDDAESQALHLIEILR